ncbi:MAG: acyl-CoA/acyl-ACP dehydrogenase [Chloroflexi bacterium]|nr:acyl-CoA/acyl-ACP dehydrogenase [Chloroflexota bacterium]
MKTERRQQIYKLAAELADEFGKRAAIHEAAGTFPYENYEDLRQSGYLKLSIPEEYGGWGASLAEIVAGQARMGEGCASTALTVTMHLSQIGRAIQTGNWSKAQLESVLHNVVTKGALLNNAASEPATGSPSRGGIPTTTATFDPTSGGWRINGRKTYTTGAPILHYFMITAAVQHPETPEGTPPKVGSFLLTREMPGLRIEETWNSLAMRLSGSHDLVLEEVQVGPEAYLGPNQKGTPQQQACSGAWGLPTAAIYFGVGRAAAKYVAQWARERVPNSLNKPISELQHIQEKAGQMELALLSAENTLFKVTELASDSAYIETQPARLAALVGATKYLVTNEAIKAVDLAMRICGGASLSMDLPLQRYYRDSRAGLGNPPMDDATILALGKLALQ